MTLLDRWKLTYEDYLTFPDDGRRHEIIDGEHFVTPAPIPRHQLAVHHLDVELGNWVEEQGSGLVLPSPIDVVFEDTSVVQPDLIWISEERRSIVTEANVQGAPDLVVEVLSPSTRRTDEIIKRKLYERFGVREYWLVDPEIETVKVWRPEAERFVRVSELTLEDDAVLTSPLLPGFSLPLRKLFA
jgi:Uma2 family endonuclease